MKYRIRALDNEAATADFRCGEAALDEYLHRYAWQDESLRKKLPRYPVPAALLGRLAVGELAQGQGLGSILLVDACKRVAAASQTLAVAAIIVDAKSPTAAAFYKHFGFVELPGQPGRWMLPRSHFAQAL